ncbi:phospholipase A [Pseudomonas sp. PS1]|uniref:Phospholipase A1 n=1 Tax=Stutzerimonas marianensis TaxID=2929513 RepID=A0A9X1W4H7_9GAMM|nr:phospholipase A [Pseudomonas marianensis]
MAAWLYACLAAPATRANEIGPPATVGPATESAWQHCRQLDGRDARLACFDHWARQQTEAAAAEPATLSRVQPSEVPSDDTPVTRVASASPAGDCRDGRYSALSRFWELEAGTDCGTFGVRGYRPLSMSISTATHRPEMPASLGGRAVERADYQASEARIGLSLRTKVAQNLLTRHDIKQDSLWFGYSQQSTWQLFNEDISRPFRSTDHEPEIMYVYPTDLGLPGGWRLRYAGAGVVHQSNGESEPQSRSWNRAYLMGGMEIGDRYQINGRIWHRIREAPANDDNPDIADYIGRAEITGRWSPGRSNAFDATLRSNLRSNGHGSIRLEWFKVIGDPATSNLRLHTQLFHGYGDTLVDYNRSRTVLSIGLSLVDF